MFLCMCCVLIIERLLGCVKKNINTRNWPAKSPDLKPIESVWRSLVLAVYSGGKITISKMVPPNACFSLNISYINTFVSSMKNPVFKLIQSKAHI